MEKVESSEEEQSGFGTDETTEKDESQESSTDETESTESIDNAIEDDTDDSESESSEETTETETEEEHVVKKTPVQKRIDKLTAEKYQAQEETARLEERLKALETKSEKRERVYTNAELDQAERKAISDNDIALLADVNKERLKNATNNLRNEYQQEKVKANEAKTQTSVEWNRIMARWGDDDNPDLDIRNKDSQLFRVAKQYFEDTEMKSEYSGSGGMERAIADAFKFLMLAKRNKKSPKDKKLERKVAKERSKKQLSTGSSGKGTKGKKLQSNDDYFKEFVKGHKARQNKALGIT